jgi:hypothetical protein
MTPLYAVRWLAAVTVALAVPCLVLAVQWKGAHDEALCWRAFHDAGEVPPEGDCRRL